MGSRWGRSEGAELEGENKKGGRRVEGENKRGWSRMVKVLNAPEPREQGDKVPLLTCSSTLPVWALILPLWASCA